MPNLVYEIRKGHAVVSRFPADELESARRRAIELSRSEEEAIVSIATCVRRPDEGAPRAEWVDEVVAFRAGEEIDPDAPTPLHDAPPPYPDLDFPRD